MEKKKKILGLTKLLGLNVKSALTKLTTKMSHLIVYNIKRKFIYYVMLYNLIIH